MRIPLRHQHNRPPGATSPAAPPPVQRAAWRDLPPLRPTLTSTPPVAPRDSFTASLATSHNPSFLAPLGHVVDPDGPSGQVAGLASPVAPQAISSGPELPVAQRQASSSRHRSAIDGHDGAAATHPQDVVLRSGPADRVEQQRRPNRSRRSPFRTNSHPRPPKITRGTWTAVSPMTSHHVIHFRPGSGCRPVAPGGRGAVPVRSRHFRADRVTAH